MKSIIKYLSLDRIGGFELLFASAPLLSGYSFLGLPFSFLIWILILFISLKKNHGRKLHLYKPIVLLLVYVFIHDLILVLGAEKNFNGYINTLILMLSIVFAAPVLDIKKLTGSLNIIAIISILGLSYQMTSILAGSGVHPLEIPFLDMSQSRLDFLALRPSSFFMEPAAYTGFMFLPLALSLIENKYIWSICIIISVFLTGSTTGFLTSFIMFGVYMFTQKVGFKYMVWIGIVGTLMFYALSNMEVFEEGREKLNNTDVETNMRLSQGPYVVKTMEPSEYVFGVNYGSPYDYCQSGRASMVTFYTEEVFMSTFWYMILMYGFFGLILYLYVYMLLCIKNRNVIPLVFVLFALLFSSGYSLGVMYAYTMIGLLKIATIKDIYSFSIKK